MSYQMTIFDMDSYQEHLDHIHITSNGWITIANKDQEDGRWSQRHYKIDELITKPEIITELSDYDTYFSQNTFYKTYRRIECLKELKTLYVDLDLYNTKYSKSQVRMAIEYMAKDGEIPRPNLIIDSGRGLYVVWTIKAVPYQALPLWKAMEHNLYDKFKKYGADGAATDPTRVLRVAGTYNSKTNTKVSIIDTFKYEYDLHDLKLNYLPELAPKPIGSKRKSGRPVKIVNLYNIYTLYAARLEDIMTLCELRNYDLHNERFKCRENILFLYRYWTCCFTDDTEKALEDALELNGLFKNPLRERIVIRATSSAEKAYISNFKKYNYKNDTLIDMLKISMEEQKQLKTIIGRVEKYERNNDRRKDDRRNDQGLTQRQQEKADKEKEIIKLINKGLNKNQIAQAVNVHRNTISRYYGHLFK